MSEIAITFSAGDCSLLGIIHQAEPVTDVGVLIVVGGPQYRVGSHRQFIQMARMLCLNGISCFRFDYRGMGDSQGNKVTFDNIDLDIRAAVDAFIAKQPDLKKIIIWGLCDAASAALIYAHKDKRVTGLILLNPWLRNEQAMGKSMIKHYYLRRLLSKSFWQKLLSGNVNIFSSAKDVKGFIQDSVTQIELKKQSYQERMQIGLKAFEGDICMILSGNDLTAAEFEQQTSKDKLWKKLRRKGCETHHIKDADHTFSSSKFKENIESITKNFAMK
jgi:exosortase A-associated hydrolase 1